MTDAAARRAELAENLRVVRERIAGACRKAGRGADEVTLVESGPLRAILRVKNHFQNSTFVRDITVTAGSPRVDVNMTADWHEKHILLKVAMPVSAHNKMATFEIPHGVI